MAKAIEASGIPVALITALTTLAEDVGAMRIVQGVRIPHPCGHPGLPPDRDRVIRRRILDTALEALQKEVSKPTVFVNPSVLM